MILDMSLQFGGFYFELTFKSPDAHEHALGMRGESLPPLRWGPVPPAWHSSVVAADAAWVCHSLSCRIWG